MINPSLDVTVPFPVPPVALTVSVNCCAVKVAVTVLFALIVIVQVVPEGASHPPQPPNVDPLAAAAVSVATVPLA